MPRIYASLVQSNLGRGHHGNFEAVLTEGEQLWYWYRDNSNAELDWTPDNSSIRLPWIRAQRVTGDQDKVAWAVWRLFHGVPFRAASRERAGGNLDWSQRKSLFAVLAETVNCLYKAELVQGFGRWHDASHLERPTPSSAAW